MTIGIPRLSLSLPHSLAGIRVWPARPKAPPPPPPLSLREIDEALRDSGLSPDDLLGLRSDGAEPFFFRRAPGEGWR